MSEIIDQALEKDPRARFLSATEMYAELCSFHEGGESGIDREITTIRQMFGNDRDQLTKAEATLKDLIAQHPRYSKAQQCLGELYNLCQRYHEAISAFEEGLEFDPDNALLHWDLALAYQKVGRREEAARYLEKVMESAPDASLRRHARTLLNALQGSMQ